MKRVTGIGGIFFKTKDASALQAWYKLHLGIDVQEWGGASFDWTDAEGEPVAGTTAWSIDLSFPFHETRHEVDDPIASDSAIYHHETEFSTVVDSRYDIETKSGSCRLDDRRLPFEPPGPPCMVVGPQIRFIS